MFKVNAVTSNQSDLHPRLEDYVKKHLRTSFQRPENHLQREIKAKIEPLIQNNQAIILDTGCGKGESSIYLAEKFPDHLIIAIDKSADRLDSLNKAKPQNLEFFRTDLIDFWMVAQKNRWIFEKTYLLYPNPWPKSEHARRRWHMHAIFPAILETSKKLELRSNWLIYIQEFAQAFKLATEQTPSYQIFTPNPPVTAFERKYARDHQTLYQLELSIPFVQI